MNMKMKRKNPGWRELKNLQPSDKDEDEAEIGDWPFLYPQLTDEEIEENIRENERKRFSPEDHRRQVLKCSQSALDYYNKKNRTNYELVEPTSSHEFCSVPVWVHLNFTAKPKSAPNDNGDGDGNNSSTKLFFAELHHVPYNWVATKCVILKGKSGHCDFCKGYDTINHPTRGFRMQQKFVPYSLRSRYH